MGRATKLTPELLNRICDLVRSKGVYPAQAAQVCDVSESTHYEWLQRGRGQSHRGLDDPDGLYAEYAESLKKAESTLELAVVEDTLGKVKRSKNPIPGFIFLSRRFRDRWAETVNVGIATREGVAAMERIKDAWNAPAAVVEGEFREVPGQVANALAGEPLGLAAPGELVGSQNGHSATQSEANSSLGFHAAPPDDAPGEGAEATAEAAPDSPPGQTDNNNLPPTNLSPTTKPEGTHADFSKPKKFDQPATS